MTIDDFLPPIDIPPLYILYLPAHETPVPEYPDSHETTLCNGGQLWEVCFYDPRKAAEAWLDAVNKWPTAELYSDAGTLNG